MKSAGQELGVTHAAVSTTISRLEARLGVQLFTRGAGVLGPTEECRRLIDAYRAATSALSRAVTLVSGPTPAAFTVSLPRGAAETWLCDGLDVLRAGVRTLALRIHADGEAPDFGVVDAAVVPGGIVPPPDCDGVPLFDECLTAVCTQHYAYAQRVATPAAIARATVLVHSRDDWRRWFEEAGLAVGAELKGVDVGDPALALQLALAGQGICLAGSEMVRGLIDAGRLVAPVPVSLATGRRFWLAWPRSWRPSDDLLRLEDWLRASLGKACDVPGGRGQAQRVAAAPVDFAGA